MHAETVNDVSSSKIAIIIFIRFSLHLTLIQFPNIFLRPEH